MNNSSRILFSIIPGMLLSCAIPIKGEWEGVEIQTSIDGEIQSKTLPYEECYPAIDPETGELDEENLACVKRSFHLSITDENKGSLVLLNGEAEGHSIDLKTQGLSSSEFELSDGKYFDFRCSLESKTLDCDFTFTIGYLQKSNVVFDFVEDVD
jgi:hypothetical protein